MDNFLIFIIIACVILWWDGRRRKKATSKAWKDIGNDTQAERETAIYNFPPREEIIDTPKMDVQEELKEVLAVLKQVMDEQNEAEEHITDLVDEVLTEIPSNVADAKSALKALGYKNGDINKAVGEITNTMDMKSGEIVISALRILNA